MRRIKTGANQYEVLVNEQTIGQLWNWHGSWSAQADGETYDDLKSRKEAAAECCQQHLTEIEWGSKLALIP